MTKQVEKLLRILAPEHLPFEARLGNKSRRWQLCFAASVIRHHLFSTPQPPKWTCWYSSLHPREDWAKITDNCSKLLWFWREAQLPSTDHIGGQFIPPAVPWGFSKNGSDSDFPPSPPCPFWAEPLSFPPCPSHARALVRGPSPPTTH